MNARKDPRRHAARRRARNLVIASHGSFVTRKLAALEWQRAMHQQARAEHGETWLAHDLRVLHRAAHRKLVEDLHAMRSPLEHLARAEQRVAGA